VRALLEERVAGAVAQARSRRRIADADTFFGMLPSLTVWAFDAERVATIQQPVLSVLGTETEPLWLEVAAFLRSSLPHVEECAIGGIGHLLHNRTSRAPRLSDG
jgi:hypothetical protein